MDRKRAPSPDNTPGSKRRHVAKSNATRQQQISASSTVGVRSKRQTDNRTASHTNADQRGDEQSTKATGSSVPKQGSKSAESEGDVAPRPMGSTGHDRGPLRSGEPMEAVDSIRSMDVAEVSQSDANHGSRAGKAITSPIHGQETLAEGFDNPVYPPLRKNSRSEVGHPSDHWKEELSQQFQEQLEQIADIIPSARELQSLRQSNTLYKQGAERRNAQLADSKRELDVLRQENKQREEAQHCLQSEVQQLSNNLHRVTTDSHRFDARLRHVLAQLDESQARNEHLQAKLKKHETKSECNEDQIRNLYALNEELRTQNEKQDTKLRETQRELLKLERAQRSTGLRNEKTSDSDLQSQWMQLDCKIRNLAYTLSEHAPAGGFIENPETSQRFSAIPRGGHEEILRDATQSWLLVQAYLWRVAFGFVYPYDHELTPFIEQFEGVRLSLLTMDPNDSPAMAAWFAERWQTVDKQYEADRYVNISAFEEATLLAGFVPNGLRNNDAISKVQSRLWAILDKTRVLCATMGGSRAVFRRDWLNPVQDTCLYYDQEIMEKANVQKAGCEVLFTISPRVVKHGTADGRDHSCQLTLTKAKVVLMEKAVDEGGDDSSCEESDDEMAWESDDDMMDAEFTCGEDSASN